MVAVNSKVVAASFTERSGTERNWSSGTQLDELYCSEKGRRALYYVHNVIVERKTVNYSYCIVNIITNLQSMLKKKKIEMHTCKQVNYARNKA